MKNEVTTSKLLSALKILSIMTFMLWGQSLVAGTNPCKENGPYPSGDVTAGEGKVKDGVLNDAGKLSFTSKTVYVGDSIPVPKPRNLDLDGGEKALMEKNYWNCKKDTLEPQLPATPVAYTPVYSWDLAIPKKATVVGTETYTLSVYGKSSSSVCSDTGSEVVGVYTVTVKEAPPVALDYIACSNARHASGSDYWLPISLGATTLTAIPTGGSFDGTLTWSNGSTGTSITVLLTDPGVYTYSVTYGSTQATATIHVVDVIANKVDATSPESSKAYYTVIGSTIPQGDFSVNLLSSRVTKSDIPTGEVSFTYDQNDVKVIGQNVLMFLWLGERTDITATVVDTNAHDSSPIPYFILEAGVPIPLPIPIETSAGLAGIKIDYNYALVEGSKTVKYKIFSGLLASYKDLHYDTEFSHSLMYYDGNNGFGKGQVPKYQGSSQGEFNKNYSLHQNESFDIWLERSERIIETTFSFSLNAGGHQSNNPLLFPTLELDY